MKKGKFFILLIFLLFLIIAFLIVNKIFNSGDNLIELNVNEVIEKVKNKEDFVLCISQTTCSHCADYKPKLETISKKYNIDIFYIDFDKYSDEEKNQFRNYVSFGGSTPVTAFIKNGEEVTSSNRLFGNVSTSKVIEKLKSNGFIKEK